jgi:hypothetical protein
MENSRIERNQSIPAATSEKEFSEVLNETKESMPSFRSQEIPNQRTKKASAIRRACTEHDVEALVMHATSEGGLLEDELRKIACKLAHALGMWFWLTNNIGPILLRCDEQLQHMNTTPVTQIPPHADKEAEKEQVDLDVNRSFVYYPQNGMLSITHRDICGDICADQN